jgi:hypothetical protein
MIKKLTLLAMAVGALVALAGPASASAATLTQGGVSLKKGDTITATSSNTITQFAAGKLECKKVHLSGIVESNAGGSFEIVDDPEGVNSASECVFNVGVPVPAVVKPTLNRIAVEGDAGEAQFEFTAKVAEGPSCNEVGEAEVEVTTGKDEIHVLGEVNGPEGCLSGGVLSGTFTLERNGNPIIIS